MIGFIKMFLNGAPIVLLLFGVSAAMTAGMCYFPKTTFIAMFVALSLLMGAIYKGRI
jgi:hypothetical protein